LANSKKVIDNKTQNTKSHRLSLQF